MKDAAPIAGPRPRGPRFHALDGMRGSLMILGIFLHIAWFLMPGFQGVPLSDADAAVGFSYFVYWVHTFRMQAFFLLTGFFACLVIQRRSLRAFIDNRFMRIVLPFAIFLPPMYVLYKYFFRVGGLISGRISSDESAWALTLEHLRTVNWLYTSLTHLWFLYTLLLLCAGGVVVYWLFERILDRDRRLRDPAQRAMSRILGARWGFLLLAIPVAGLMLAAGDLRGVETDTIVPDPFGTFVYGIFFASGWCLYRAPELLDRLRPRWRSNFALGTVIAVGLGVAWTEWRAEGRLPMAYPLIESADFADYGEFRARALKRSDPTSMAVWSALSDERRALIEENDSLSADQLTGLGAELNRRVLATGVLVPPEVLDGGSSEEAMLVGRRVLVREMGGAIVDYEELPLWRRVLHFLGYGCASWLMTFGVIGLFQSHFSRPSSAARYVSDSSYWLYILHIPILFLIQVTIAPLSIGWFAKIIIYTVVTFTILLVSYHYGVRSTWMGALLNGRRYPLESGLFESLGLRWPRRRG